MFLISEGLHNPSNMYNQLQVSMPQSNVVILTDPASDLPVRRNRVAVFPIQGEYSRDTLMLQRIRSYIVRAHLINI